jgi:2-polyprenyl-3-methyl-5-hydroxy-6-metoxy-1,4-benzoquinol methylase
MSKHPHTKSTVDYYNDTAEQFFSSTLMVDMSPIYQRFLDGLPVGAHILDAGCGSGRDARLFADRGFAVSAFDASDELAKRASAHCGFEVKTQRFQDVTEIAQYDAIWCCASLLHVPLAEMLVTLSKLWAALKAGLGTKYERVSRGRYRYIGTSPAPPNIRLSPLDVRDQEEEEQREREKCIG